MALIVKQNTFSVGTTAASAQVNADFDTIYNDYNGNITDANVAASGITTYGKVSGTALSGLGSVAAGAGTIPIANIPYLDEDDMASDSDTAVPTQQSVKAYVDALSIGTKVKTGFFTRTLNAADGDVAYTGVGFKPKGLIITAGGPGYTTSGLTQMPGFGASEGQGVVSPGNNFVVYQGEGTANWNGVYPYCVVFVDNGTWNAIAQIVTFDSDGFTLSWKSSGGPPATTRNIGYMAIG